MFLKIIQISNILFLTLIISLFLPILIASMLTGTTLVPLTLSCSILILLYAHLNLLLQLQVNELLSKWK